MHPRWNRGYEEGLQPQESPDPGQSVRSFVDEIVTMYEKYAHIEFWIDYPREAAEAESEWYKGYIAGVKAQWNARLKEEEMYGKR